ncbi:MAG: 2Fe-2S iron-sulfur cluster-binding protein, partial [Nocardioidaceae bacterium]
RDLEDLLEIHTVDDAYLCGPRDMTRGVRDALVERGLERERVHVELFGGSAPAPSATQTAPLSTAPGTLTARNVAVVDRGARTEVSVNPGETVLDAALRSGLDLPYSCRDGVCGTCRAKLACGQVNQDNAELSPAEIAAGYVLTCQAKPESDGVVISVDEG